jgi:hypothetical protein
MTEMTGRFRRRSGVESEVIGGEAVIINLATGVYYSMDRTGAYVWEALANGATPAEVVAALGPSALTAAADVARVVDEAVREGLIEPAPAASAPALPPPPGSYAPPALTAYRDMGDLLALDPPAPGLDQVSWKASATDAAER